MDSRNITDPLNRGMVGGLLGMPADMLNMLRNGGRSVGNLANRLAGVNAPPAPMVENPVYGQEWWGDKMQKAGYVSPNRNKLAEFGAGLLDPGSVMTDVPMLAKGLFALGDPALQAVTKGLLAKRAYDVAPDVARTAAKNLSAPATLNKPGFAGQRGAVVWHGSPHAFDAFDSSKIGTGEGAQAYGHGLYLAESKKVADEYAGKLSKKMVSIDGFGGNSVEKSILDKLSARANSTQYGGGARAVLDDLHSISRFGTTEEKAAANAMLRKIGPFGLPSVEDAGSLYKVDLPDEDISRMLDWDKPLSEQSNAVKKAIGLDKNPDATIKNMTGLEFYVATGQKLGEPTSASKAAAQHLLTKGILGTRYLDGGSRGTGQGSSNFVVFPGNENRLKILERNGKPVK